MEDFEKTRALREMARTTDTHTLFRELVFLTRRGARHEGGNNVFGCRLAAIYRAEIMRRIPVSPLPGASGEDNYLTAPVPRRSVRSVRIVTGEG
jgi:hypothetical protein